MMKALGGVKSGILLVFLGLLAQPRVGAAPAGVLERKVEADCLLKKGETVRAIRLYRNILKEDSAFSNAHYNLATAYYLTGNLGKASESLENFLRRQPTDIEARYNLGCLYLRLGRFYEAEKQFRTALHGPANSRLLQKTKEALHFLEDLRNQNSDSRRLFTYLVTGSEQSLLGI